MKSILILVFSLLCSLSAFSQSAPKAKPVNASLDASGNFTQVIHKRAGAVAAVSIGKTFTTKDGQKLPVMKSKNGKLFVVRTSKAGKEYNYYLNTGE